MSRSLPCLRTHLPVRTPQRILPKLRARPARRASPHLRRHLPPPPRAPNSWPIAVPALMRLRHGHSHAHRSPSPLPAPSRPAFPGSVPRGTSRPARRLNPRRPSRFLPGALPSRTLPDHYQATAARYHPSYSRALLLPATTVPILRLDPCTAQKQKRPPASHQPHEALSRPVVHPDAPDRENFVHLLQAPTSRTAPHTGTSPLRCRPDSADAPLHAETPPSAPSPPPSERTIAAARS